VIIVPDDLEIIARDVATLSRSYDVVFTSGGVGPTHDDVTIQAVAQAFSVDTRIDPVTCSLLVQHYGAHCTDVHLRMAVVPEGARLTTTSDVAWPTVVMRNVWVLPGVPEIFRMKLDVIRQQLHGPSPFFSRAVFTRLDEPSLTPWLDRLVSDHPGVSIGSYTKWLEPRYRTKVTFDARDADPVQAAVQQFLRYLPEGEPVAVE
jgi:molybdopterin-biosynthesis enzyme MoeA-like protein